MTMDKYSNITPFQLFSITLFSVMFGLNLYPSSIGHEISNEWLIAQIISIIAVFPILYMLIEIFSEFESSFEDGIFKIIGNVPSRILGGLFSLYFLLHSLRLIMLEANNIQLFLFDKTPANFIALIIIITAFFISVSGIQSLAKLAEILCIPMLILIAFMFFMFFSASDFTEAKVYFQPNTNNILSQAVNNISCISSIEMTAFFLCRVKSRSARKAALFSGYAVLSLVLISLTLCIAGIFTVKAGADLIYPVIELARTVQLKFLRVVERFDAVIFFVTIAAVCVFVSIALFCSSSSLSLVFRPLKFRYSIPIYLTAIVCVIFFMNNRFSDLVSNIVLYSEIVILFAVIPVLFIISKIRKRACSGDN